MTEREEYYLALGRFTNAMSRFESALHLNFHHFSKIDPTIGNILKRQSSANTVVGWVKALMAVNDFSEKDRHEFEILAAQFSEIDAFRDKVIHRGAKLMGDGALRSHNLPTIRKLESLEITDFSVDHIHAAAEDMECIGVRLSELVESTNIRHSAQLQAVLRAPWRYKPVKPQTPDDPQPGSPPRPPRQPKASRKKR